MSFVSAPQAPQSQLFTCLTCQVAFHTAERQRTHYRSDWHRYNLKRKVAELTPVSADAFASKVLAQQVKQEASQEEASSGLMCLPCKKKFTSESTYNNHILSKKHKEALTKYEQNNPEGCSKETFIRFNDKASMVSQVTEDDEGLDEEAKLLKRVDAKIASAARLTEVDCLFCAHQAADFDSNLTHMTDAHDFMIPDIEYLADIRGLIKYLGEKISVANVCLYCNGKGREIKSLSAVRKHMIDKGHAKIAYDLDMDIMEISDYYNFASSYGDEADENEELTNRPAVAEGVQVGDSEYELILPSGARIGHRSLHRYFKQNVRPIDEQEARSVNRLIDYYSKSNKFQDQYEARGRRLAITQAGEQKQAAKQIFKAQRADHLFRTRVGISGNKLQHHYREQIL